MTIATIKEIAVTRNPIVIFHPSDTASYSPKPLVCLGHADELKNLEVQAPQERVPYRLCRLVRPADILEFDEADLRAGEQDKPVREAGRRRTQLECRATKLPLDN